MMKEKSLRLLRIQERFESAKSVKSTQDNVSFQDPNFSDLFIVGTIGRYMGTIT